MVVHSSEYKMLMDGCCLIEVWEEEECEYVETCVKRAVLYIDVLSFKISNSEDESEKLL